VLVARRLVFGPAFVSPEVLGDELVRLDVLEAFRREPPVSLASPLSLRLVLDRVCTASTHDAVPEVAQHPRSVDMPQQRFVTPGPTRVDTGEFHGREVP
jgi:hypothetical protein